MFKTAKSITAICFATAFLVACVAPPKLMVGDAPAAKPPQLVRLATSWGGDAEVIIWDNPLAFGPVPESLQYAADVSCMITRIDLFALGYHPRARDRNGNTLPGGGYFCAPKAHGAEPAETPPRLIISDDNLVWDNPSAFGAVPLQLMAQGRSACRESGPDHQPIGYHPDALGEDGAKLPNGGFFCVSSRAQ